MSVNCSINTAPSSPGRNSLCSNLSDDFYLSEPTSPTHFLTQLLKSSESQLGNNLTRSVGEEHRNEYITAQNSKICGEIQALNGVGDHVSSSTSFEFEFSSRHSDMDGDQPFAEELFVNGQIRPLNEQRRLPPSSGSNLRSFNASGDEDEFNVGHGASKGKDDTKISKGRSTSLRIFLWEDSVKENRIHQGKVKVESQRDSCGTGSKRWRLKDFLDRSGSDRKRGKDMLRRLPSLNIPPAKQAQKHGIKKYNIFQNQSKQGRIDNSALNPAACTGYDETLTISKPPGVGIRINKPNGARVSAYSPQELPCKEKGGEDEKGRRSFLPDTRSLLRGLMNGLTRNLHPFSSI